jgi:hypothetical protein
LADLFSVIAIRVLHWSFWSAFSRVNGSESCMSNQSECMYWVFSFIAEEKIRGFQPMVSNRW